MEVGMLWFDNSNEEKLEIKIQRAKSYYKKKYGQTPNLCFVHPSMFKINKPTPRDENEPEKSVQLKEVGLELRSSKSLLPDHFWLGIHQESSAA
ncbi:MAG: hypothetical protein ABFS03_10675 [Chloroflexota bacterium]